MKKETGYFPFQLGVTEGSLRQYYEPSVKARYSVVKFFLDRVKQLGQQPTREHPRYEHRVVQPEPDRVIQEVMGQYKRRATRNSGA